jgi:hypothetical protein
MSLKTPRNNANKDLDKSELIMLTKALNELNSDISTAVYSLSRELPVVDLRTIEELLYVSNRNTYSISNELKGINSSLERLADCLCQKSHSLEP